MHIVVHAPHYDVQFLDLFRNYHKSWPYAPGIGFGSKHYSFPDWGFEKGTYYNTADCTNCCSHIHKTASDIAHIGVGFSHDSVLDNLNHSNIGCFDSSLH